MSRRLVPLSLENLADLPTTCPACGQGPPGGPAHLTPESVREVLLDWGTCGVLAYDDGAFGNGPAPAGNGSGPAGNGSGPAGNGSGPAGNGSGGSASALVGFAIFVPPHYARCVAGMTTAPVSRDAVLLGALYVAPQARGGGVGRMLLQSSAAALVQRGAWAMEAYGAVAPDRITRRARVRAALARTAQRVRAPWPGVSRTPSAGDPRGLVSCCLVPVGFLQSVGFTVVRAHRSTPRMRLDLRTTVRWRNGVGHALDRLRGSVRPPVLTTNPALRVRR